MIFGAAFTRFCNRRTLALMRAKKSVRRKPARTPSKKSRDAAATKADLLAAGEAQFAERGYDGATIDDICARSGVNRALISYYFGSKDGLYDAVISRIVRETLLEIDPKEISLEDPAAALKEFAVRLAQTMARRRTFPALLLREYLASRPAAREGPARDIVKFYAVTEKILAAGKKKRLFRALDAHVVHLALVGPILHFIIAEPFRKAAFGKVVKGVTNPSIEAFAADLADIVIAGLRRTDRS